MEDKQLKEGEKPMFMTASLCPECLKTVPMAVFEKDGRALLRKTCSEHGTVEDVYWGDADMLRKATKWAHDGKGVQNPNTKGVVCPRDCGLCPLHKSHTALGNIVVTSRCNLNCWYCFFSYENLVKLGYVYEPSLEQIRAMLKNMRGEKPVSCNAVQITGGEPCMRNDLVDIIRLAKEEGYEHIQLNINGIKLSHDASFAGKIGKAGVNTIYLSFDGTTPKTNPKNHWEIPRALDNCRKADVGVVLVPTVINTVNDHDLGNIMRFGVKNMDIVRAVNYQPVSFVGRVSDAERKKFRITIPDAIHRIAEQTDNAVAPEDWYPVPTVTGITHFIEAMMGKPSYELTAHHACGMATYLFVDNGKIVPIPRFVDVDGLMEYLNENAAAVMAGKSKAVAAVKLVANIGKFIDRKKQPKGMDVFKLLSGVLVKGSYEALGDLQRSSLLLGMMHFQDLYNYDLERVKRCCIHYAVPDGRILPFCTFNVIPEWYRDKVQKQFSVPIEQWQKDTGRKVVDDIYRRDVRALEADPLYKKTYEGFI